MRTSTVRFDEETADREVDLVARPRRNGSHLDLNNVKIELENHKRVLSCICPYRLSTGTAFATENVLIIYVRHVV